MSLYSIYFTQVLLPLLDLRYSQSHSNITIATGKCIFVLFCHFSELIRHLRAFPSFTNYEQVFCVCFQKFAATYIKKKFCHVSVSHEYFFSTVFFNSFSQESLISVQHLLSILYNINMTWRNYKWYEWSFCSRRMTSKFQF